MEGKIRQAIRNILTGAAILLAAVLAGTVLMTLVYMIPLDQIRKNVANSSDIYDSEGLTNSYIPWLTSTRMDNYTDTIMLSIAAMRREGSALRDAMESKYVYVTIKDMYDGPGYLLRMLDLSEDGSSIVVSYARYWHGYLLFLKPLLTVFDISGIRIVNAVFQIVMMFLILMKMAHDDDLRKMIIPLLLITLLINPVSTVLNMQYACIYNIMLVAILVLVRTGITMSDKYWILFLITGIAVAFFDFLTYPLASLGIPLILLLVKRRDDSKTSLITMIISCLSWGIGYVFMWGSKWVVSDLITGGQTISDALEQITVRTVTDAYEATGIRSDNIIEVFGYNLEAFRDPFSVSLFAAAIIGFVLYVIISKKSFKLTEDLLIPLLLIALIPFAWYAVCSNHSAIHFWMTYRNLVLTVMAIAAILVCSVSKKKN